MLVKIAKNIDFVSVYAKQLIFKRYYDYYLEHFKLKRRKRKFI